MPSTGFFIYTSTSDLTQEKFEQSVRLDDGRVVQVAIHGDGRLDVQLFDNDEADECEYVIDLVPIENVVRQ